MVLNKAQRSDVKLESVLTFEDSLKGLTSANLSRPPGSPHSFSQTDSAEDKCNPTFCPDGLVCQDDPKKCCKKGEWSCCGDFDPFRLENRMYCPLKDANNVMCNDGHCVPSEDRCAKFNGVKFTAEKCGGEQEGAEDDDNDEDLLLLDWETVFMEAGGSGNGKEFDNSDERTLNYKVKGTEGGDYWVRLSWGDGFDKWVTFRVPLGSDIFSPKYDPNIPVHEVTTSEEFEPSFSSGGKSARFCHACVKDGFRAEDTCWALTTEKDSKRNKGCSAKHEGEDYHQPHVMLYMKVKRMLVRNQPIE